MSQTVDLVAKLGNKNSTSRTNARRAILINSARIWLASLLLPSSTAKVLNAIRSVVDIVNIAIPVVSSVNDELKVALNNGDDPYKSLSAFLSKYGAEQKAKELSHLPWDSLLHGAAVAAIETLVIQPVPKSALRLGAEVAYWAYRTANK